MRHCNYESLGYVHSILILKVILKYMQIMQNIQPYYYNSII